VTADPIGRRALCRGLVSRAARAVTRTPAETVLNAVEGNAEDHGHETTATPAVPDYFASFDQCHTLIAEMRPFLADAIRDLGIDPRGKSDVELAREIMAHQCATPARQRTDADDEAPTDAPGPAGDH
jgi:hypothetical protein